MLLYLSYLALALVSVFLITLPISLFFQLLINREKKGKGYRPSGSRTRRVRDIAWLTAAVLVVGGIIGNAAIYGARSFGRMFSLEQVELDRPVKLLVVSPRHRDVLAGGPPQEAPAAVIDDPAVIEAVYSDLEGWRYNRYASPRIPSWWRTYIVTAFFSEEEWQEAENLMEQVRCEQSAYEQAMQNRPDRDPVQLYPDSSELEAMRLYKAENDWQGGRVCRFTLAPNCRVRVEEGDPLLGQSEFIASRLQKGKDQCKWFFLG